MKYVMTGLKDYPEIRKSIKEVSKSLISLTKEKSHKGDILAGIATNIAILQLHHEKIRQDFTKEKLQ